MGSDDSSSGSQGGEVVVIVSLFLLAAIPLGVGLGLLALLPGEGSAWKFSAFRAGSVGLLVGITQGVLLLAMREREGGQVSLSSAASVGLFGLLFGAMFGGGTYILGYGVLDEFHNAVLIGALVFAQCGVLVLHLGSVVLGVGAWHLGAGRIVALHVGFLALFGQLGFSMAFGEVFLNDLDAEWAKVLACALYPIIIVVFKVVQKVTLIAAAPQLEPAVEFGSLALAALPYRVVFLGLGNWVTFVLVLIVELIFKALAYPIQFSKTFHAISRKIKEWTQPCRTCTSPPENDTDIESEGGRGDDAIAQVQAKLASKFFFHTLVDTFSIFGVATVLFYLREERDVSPVAKSVLSDAKFMRLLTQYGASFGFEVVFVGLALLVSRSLFDAVHFRPLTHARKPLNAYILILGLFYCVVYTGTFVVVDVENVPISA